MGEKETSELDESEEFVGSELIATVLGVVAAFSVCVFGLVKVHSQVKNREVKHVSRTARSVSNSQPSVIRPHTQSTASLPKESNRFNHDKQRNICRKYRFLEYLAVLALCSVVIANLFAFMNYSTLYIFMNKPNKGGIWHWICRCVKLLFLLSTAISYTSVCLFWFDRIPATFGDLSDTISVSKRVKHMFYASLFLYLMFELTIMIYTFLNETVLVHVKAVDFNPYSQVNSYIVECDMSAKGERIENILFACKGAWLVIMNMVVAKMYITRLNAVFNDPLPRSPDLAVGNSSITEESDIHVQTFSFSNNSATASKRSKGSKSMGTPRMQEKQNRLLKKTSVIALVSTVSTVILFGITAVTGIHVLPEIDLVINAMGIVCFFRFGDPLYQYFCVWLEPIPEAISQLLNSE